MATRYIDTDYLIKRVDESTIKELLDITDITDGKVISAINDAEDRVDEYINVFYDVPLSIIPSIIKETVLAIAVYNIYQYRYDNELPEHIVRRYNEAISFLKSVESGKHKIDDLENKSTTSFKIITNKTSDDKVFNSTKLSQIL